MARKITCTINNQTSGSLTYNADSTTGGSLSISTNTIDSGSSEQAFEAEGPSAWVSGCGGQVTYNLPNDVDQLTVVYNCSTTGESTQVFVQLQNQNGKNVGSDAYFVVVDPASVVGTELAPTITVYESGTPATAQTGCVNDSSVKISIQNNLASWITLNNFANPAWDIQPIITDGTSGVAPGGSAVILASAEAYDFALVFNLDDATLLTVTQNGYDAPTAGLNVGNAYSTSVSGGTATNGYAYTVTVAASVASDVLSLHDRETGGG